MAQVLLNARAGACESVESGENRVVRSEQVIQVFRRKKEEGIEGQEDVNGHLIPIKEMFYFLSVDRAVKYICSFSGHKLVI